MVIGKFKTNNWYIQVSSGVPHTNHYVWYAVTKGINDVHDGTGLKYAATFFENNGDICTWCIDMGEMERLGRKFQDSPNLFDLMFNKWIIANKSFLEFTDMLYKNGIRDILKDYKEFKRRYTDEYSPAMVVEYFMVYSDILINEIRKDINKKEWGSIEKLITPFKKTFVYDEKESLFRVALEIGSLNNIKRNIDKIKRHQEEFFWMQNNYKYTDPIKLDIFVDKVEEILSNKKIEDIKKELDELENYESNFKDKKRKVELQLKLNSKDKLALELLSKVAWWHDHRKKANMIANYWINEFLKKACGWSYGELSLLELQYSLPSEFIGYLNGKSINREVLRERVKASVSINYLNGDEYILVGSEHDQLRKQILKNDTGHKVNEIKGTTASIGNVKGKAKIIMNPRHAEINKGEILVTSMTRPDFVPLMKNAAGIVTDEGGITSHAAIVSRELGIPCIVGTKVATKVIKDNQIIEIRGNHGLVKILNV